MQDKCSKVMAREQCRHLVGSMLNTERPAQDASTRRALGEEGILCAQLRVCWLTHGQGSGAESLKEQNGESGPRCEDHLWSHTFTGCDSAPARYAVRPGG